MTATFNAPPHPAGSLPPASRRRGCGVRRQAPEGRVGRLAIALHHDRRVLITAVGRLWHHTPMLPESSHAFFLIGAIEDSWRSLSLLPSLSALRRPAELGDDALAVCSYELRLVAPDVVDVDLVEAQVYVVLDVLEVLVEI